MQQRRLRSGSERPDESERTSRRVAGWERRQAGRLTPHQKSAFLDVSILMSSSINMGRCNLTAD